MAEISTKARKALPGSAFALPEDRAYPIHDAAHVRNAAARLEQQRGSLSPAKYAKAKSAIARAAKRFGIDSEFAKSSKPRARGMRVTVDHPRHGRVEIRHMGDVVGGQLVNLGGVAELPVACADGKRVWIQIAKTGAFKGHPAGEFALTTQTFDEIVRNFRATSNRRIPIDFEHASESAATDGSIPTDGAPAQGWILDLDNRGDGGLWGLVEWLPKAAEYIKQGAYKFFSPAIRFNSRDRVTGKPVGARMTSGALTNNPFLDGMTPLVARDFDKEPETGAEAVSLSALAHAPGEYLPAFRKALRLDDLASGDEMRAKLSRLRDLYDVSGDAFGAAEGVDLASYTRDLRAMMNAPMGASVHDILDAVEEMIDAAMARHVVEDHGLDPDTDIDDADMTMADKADTETNMDENVKALKDAEAKTAELSLKLKDAESRAATLEAENKQLRDEAEKRAAAEFDARLSAAFDTYKDAKKLTDADREAMRIVLKNAPETFEKLYPKVAPSQQHLLRDVAGTGRADATKTPASGELPTMRALTDRFVKEGKSLEDATSLAFTELSQAVAQR